MDETTTVSHKANKLRSFTLFTLEFKLDAISCAKTHSNRATVAEWDSMGRVITEIPG